MNVGTEGKKSIPVVKRDVVLSLDILHRAILEVMADRGEIVIIDSLSGSAP